MKLKLEPYKEEILSMYNNGISTIQIAKHFNCYQQPVSNLIKKYTKVKSLMPDQGNINYFQQINSNIKAYFLGFITADGCITYGNSKSNFRLTITIHEKDKIILNKLKEEIGCENKILTIYKKEYDHNHVRFSLQNKELIDSLNKYGIVPQKSLIMPNIIQNIPKEYRPSFILGYFDGDGSMTTQSKYKRGYIQIRGTKELLLGIINELQISSYNIDESSNIPSLRIGSKENIKKFYGIYKTNNFFLKRKHSKFIEYFDIIKQDRTISSS